jgi:tRNA dimethylallyltransferase
MRANQMIEKGAVSEVKKYLKLKVPKDKSANKAIGISEVSNYIEKKIKIDEVIENISIKTRQYAKRQTTWGRGNMQDWKKVKPSALNKFLKKF